MVKSNSIKSTTSTKRNSSRVAVKCDPVLFCLPTQLYRVTRLKRKSVDALLKRTKVFRLIGVPKVFRQIRVTRFWCINFSSTTSGCAGTRCRNFVHPSENIDILHLGPKISKSSSLWVRARECTWNHPADFPPGCYKHHLECVFYF